MNRLLILPVFGFIFFAFNFGGNPSFKKAQKTLEGFCNYVPSGNTVINGDTVSVQAFYMSKTEITNLQYQEFLYDLKKNRKTEELKVAQIDSSAWNDAFNMAYLRPMSEYYHKHPAYHNYPVVNVSKEGAQLFCEWLTEKYDSLSGGELNIKFRIPTRAEWMRAARGNDHYKTYAWGGPLIRNVKGNILANYLRVGSEMITRDSETQELVVTNEALPHTTFSADDAFITAPSESYWPNDLGFYNMNGNVSEMISDGNFAVGGDWRSPGFDIRNESIKSFEEPDPTVGFRIVATYLQPQK